MATAKVVNAIKSMGCYSKELILSVFKAHYPSAHYHPVMSFARGSIDYRFLP
jgi:hypothetical protein